MYYATFLFDHSGFRRASNSLIEEAEAGNYNAVFEKAKAVANRSGSKEWILEGHGTSLSEFQNFDRADPAGIGFSLLVVLSQFLRPLPVELEPLEIDIVAQGAASLGWEEQDVRLLTQGMATTVLIRPGGVTDPLERPSPDDPRWKDPAYYWWWVRPLNAYSTGWWRIKQIEALHDKLLEFRDDFPKIDVTILHKPVTREHFLRYYETAIELFETAVQANTGLFYVVS